MKGVAISVYDKLDEVGVLVDIIRNHWDDEYFIAVCSSDPDTYERLSELDVDAALQAAQVEYSYDLEGAEKMSIHLNTRILDSIKKSCEACTDSGCDYVMHLHADAWPMEESTYDRLTTRLADQDAAITLRGLGAQTRHEAYWVGFMMDQFFVFDTEKAEEHRFLDFDPLDLLPHSGIHDSLCLLVLGRFGRSNVDLYSDLSGDEWWDGKSTILPYSVVGPAITNPEWNLVHVHRQSFPGNVGKSLQAHFLDAYDITSGEYVEQLLEEHLQDEEELFEAIRGIEERQDKQLRRLGYDPVRFGRRFKQKEEIVTSGRLEKAKILVENISFRAYEFLDRLASKHLLEDENIYPHWRLRAKRLYQDPEWPTRNEAKYSRLLDEDDFPEDVGEFWFE